MPSGQPRRKRLRADSESSADRPEHPAFGRDEKFWYEDGNIVIIAQETGFRVYQGLLATHSDVFRDIFSLAQPAVDDKQDETLGDCPVVHVTDTASEIRSLLAVLLPEHRFIGRLKLRSDDVANCIRLAHKYGIEDLLQDSVQELGRYFPDCFDAWDKRSQSGRGASYAIAAVNLARLTNTLSLLNGALYTCCQLDASQLLDGYTRPDGTVDILSSEDLGRCINGKARLSALYMRAVYDIFAPLSTNEVKKCVDVTGSCNAALATIRTRRMEPPIGGEGYDVLRPWDSVIRIYCQRKRNPLCNLCAKILLQREKTIRKGVWEDLPDVLALEAPSIPVANR
ncbi:uncharacterized protein B0H18DRAFT_1010059 [Fomitopsis serialis]|uniref:uncharacterized protein n=1 Tax=Fomitopsis serialis TaxID=139415 RepID=UPI0020081D65|nr:uncharacterized protein B0H18DRAFT_1010059 [Neoantrodia serialis]KAH9925147.1 hypothetical protein B0H18DRAFT_1010059 [Neoantrodia serialis]